MQTLLAFASEEFLQHDDRIVLIPSDNDVIPQGCVALPVKLDLTPVDGGLIRIDEVETPELLLGIDFSLFTQNILVYVVSLKTDYVCTVNSNVWRPLTGAAALPDNDTSDV
jgi:hypothetical protein